MKRNIILSLIAVISCIISSSTLAGTWRDDFADGGMDEWLLRDHNTAKWKIIGEELECSVPGRPNMIFVLGGEEWEEAWTDYTVEYDVKVLEDLGRGDIDVNLRMNGFGTGVLLWVGDVSSGDPEAGATTYDDFIFAKEEKKPFGPLSLNEWHHLKGEAKGNEFTFWIDGEKILEYKDGTFETGQPGFGIASYNVRIDNVKIAGPEIPERRPEKWPEEQAVTSKGKLATMWSGLKVNR